MRCPVCNIKFPMNEIEVHADSCLTMKETPFSCYLDFNEETTPNCSEEKNFASNFWSSDAVTTKVKEVLTEITPINDFVTINVRRNFCFC